MSDNWVMDLKVGDKVLITPYPETKPIIGTVERATGAQVFVRQDGRTNSRGEAFGLTPFWRKSGYAVGAATGGYRSSTIAQATPEALAKIAEHDRTRGLVNAVRDFQKYNLMVWAAPELEIVVSAIRAANEMRNKRLADNGGGEPNE